MKLNPLVMMRKEIDGTGIVFDPENNKAMTLNRTGVVIWEAVEEGCDTAQIIERMTAQFCVDAAVASQDLTGFLTTLKDKGLLSDE